MALITRLSRWFRADLNAVLDRLEEPDLVLREAIREMEEALSNQQQAHQALLAEIEQLSERSRKLCLSADAISEQLDLCFLSENEALAKQLLRRRLEQQRLADTCEQRAADTTRQAEVLNKEIQRMQEQLQDQRSKAEAFGVQAQNGDAGCDQQRVTDADVELAFLAERRARSAS
ncbi:PspA/IM30 family protein [Pseudomarimonas arenosa]|uniref:PspA/IM30 family protein n=1 Tax=Pseudomarimonas arenosa TaxID=2774145 RepID=A0AAW3ZQJ4_9GAMM|nr:PspA/IM30 family protein [Pseudomarimonas arenosa]MBD8527810.1 PspA/IM30 family protein [Pseudomarimonas arenosa]